MMKRFTAAAVLPILLAAPAFADCRQDLQKLEQAIATAETGAPASGAPTTEHQEEVLAGEEKKSVGAETTGSTDTQARSITPHQEEVTRSIDMGDRPSELMAEARKMAEAGDEQGCMEKVGEIRGLIGEN